MSATEFVSDEVFETLLELDHAASPHVASHLALATLVGACRAYCELNMGAMSRLDIRKHVLDQMRAASPVCREVFAVEH